MHRIDLGVGRGRRGKELGGRFREMQRGRASQVTVDHKEMGKTTITERIVEVDADGEDCKNND
jgi:hypothetical protein